MYSRRNEGSKESHLREIKRVLKFKAGIPTEMLAILGEEEKKS